MRVSIVAPGPLGHAGAITYADDLYARITRILPIVRRTGRQARRQKGGLDAGARTRESASLVALVPAGALAVALDVTGRRMDSDAFRDWIVGHAETGCRELCFLIGGPDGLDATARAACREAISLSPMVLPHDLAEVVLLEQVYRALTRWKNLPYHR